MSPDYETVRLTVARLRAVYEAAVSRRNQGQAALTESRGKIADARLVFETVRRRQGQPQSTGDGSTSAEYVQKTIDQAQQLLTMMEPYSAEYDRISSAIMELQQIEAMISDGSAERAQDGVVRRALVDAQRAISEASAGGRRRTSS